MCLFYTVPCYKRVKQVDNHQVEQEKVIEEQDEDGGWVDTHHYSGKSVALIHGLGSSVGCVPDWWSGGRRLEALVRQHSFIEIDHDIFSMVIISLPLIQEGKLSSYLRKNVHWVLVNRLDGLSLPRKSVVRLTDCPAMTIAVVKQQHNNNNSSFDFYILIQAAWF